MTRAVDREIELRSRVGSDNALSVRSTQGEGKRPRAGDHVIHFTVHNTAAFELDVTFNIEVE
jgi:hypothetical protein